MIAKSFLSQLTNMLPTDSFVTLRQVVAMVEQIFGASVSVERNVIIRRHINLLNTLRASGVLAVGNDKDEWRVEVERRPQQYMEVASIEGGVQLVPTLPPEYTVATRFQIETADGARFERITEEPMDEETITKACQLINADLSQPCVRYDGKGCFKIQGDVELVHLEKLLRLARAAKVNRPAKG